MEKAMSDGRKQLAEHLKIRNLDPEKLKKDNSLIQIGMEWKSKLASDLCDLRKKKARLTQSKMWKYVISMIEKYYQCIITHFYSENSFVHYIYFAIYSRIYEYI